MISNGIVPAVATRNMQQIHLNFEHDYGDGNYRYNNYNLYTDNNMAANNGTNMSGPARNGTSDGSEGDYIMTLIKMMFISVVLGLMILITVIGNVFVIAAIVLERNLQNVANYLVASLAVADLFVACLVMPLGAVYEISQGWILGAELCDIWTACDVLCCTASILHLVAIAADRYWTVTNINYNNKRTPRRVFFMIFCVWFTAVIVSLAPQFGWKDDEFLQRIEEQKCMVSQDVAYQIFATCCTFYVPLLIILVLYWKIYKIARKRIQRRTQRPPLAGHGGASHKNQSHMTDTAEQRNRKRLQICFGSAADGSSSNSVGHFNLREETEFSNSNIDNKSHAGTDLTNISSEAEDLRSPIANDDISTVSHQIAAIAATAVVCNATPHLGVRSVPAGAGAAAGSQVSPAATRHGGKQAAALASIANPLQRIAKRRQLLEAKRERKAAQTLAIITGAFAACWLPFFVTALLVTLCKSCDINGAVASFFLWLGYFNSTLNPLIYTVFNPEFRRAFQRILFGRKNVAEHCRSGKRI